MSQWVADPGPPTLAEAVDNVHYVLMTAAKTTAIALEKCQMTVEPAAEMRARGEYSAAKAEGDHWRQVMNHYAAMERLHPELRDKPLGTRCRHDGRCWVGDAAGYFVEPSEQVPWSPPPQSPPPPPPEPDSRLPPEREVGADDT